MIHLREFLLIGLLLQPVVSSFGCHCDPPHSTFYESILKTNLICLAVCERTGYEYQNNGLNAETAYFQILDPLTISDQQEGDTVLIVGQDGLNCGESVTRFNPGDTIFLALGKELYYEFGRDTFYLEGACGMYFLEIEEGKNNGLTIPQVIEKITYFKNLQVSSAFQMFNPFRTMLFESDNGSIKGLRIDSIYIDGDAHYYFNHNIGWDHEFRECDTPYGPSWAGKKVIIKENGDHIFFNRLKDSIIIRTWPVLGESWRCYEGSEYLIDALFESSDTISFLGVSDSVKSIRFRVYDRDGIEIDNELNQMAVRVSKTHGVISLLNFYLFPDLEEVGFGYIEENISRHEIAGMTSPKIGLQNFGWREIFFFAVGDEFHIVEETHKIDPEPPNGETYQERQTILTVIEAEYSEYELTYKMERIERFQEVNSNGDTYAYIHDTISNVYLPNPSLDYLPREPIFLNEMAYTSMMTGGFMPSKSFLGGWVLIPASGDSCWSTPIWDGCWPDENYYKGLGGPYGSCSGGITSYTYMAKTLVYYSNRNGIWGTPLTFTGDRPVKTSPSLRIFPNPARNHITISCDFTFTGIQIIDNTGRILLTESGQVNEQSISLSGFLPGLYYVQIQVEGKSIWRRFIVN